MPEPGSRALATLGVALLFAAVYLFGGRALRRPRERGYRRFLSFAAGVSVAYTFVHVLPALYTIRAYQSRNPDRSSVFPEHEVYLWTMVGFLVFYGLESLVGALPALQGEGEHAGGAVALRRWLHVGGFALYTGLLTYMMVWTGKDGLGLGLFAAAMGLHLLTIAGSLDSHYGPMYRRRAAFVLALASLAGWGGAMTLQIPLAWVLNLAAFVMGGVVVNASIAELAQEKQGKYWAFLAGAALYTGLLLVLSRFEHGA